MKQGRAGGQPNLTVEMVEAGGRQIITAIIELYTAKTEFVNQIIHEKNISEDWKDSQLIVGITTA